MEFQKTYIPGFQHQHVLFLSMWFFFMVFFYFIIFVCGVEEYVFYEQFPAGAAIG